MSETVITMLISGGMTLLGMVIGRWVFRPFARSYSPPKQPKPICGCNHELSFHDPKNGICHGTVRQPSRYDYLGNTTAWMTVQCTCKQYVGPQPLSTIYAPEITGE
jgi:hypothetical protein